MHCHLQPPQYSDTITVMTLSCHTYLVALHKNACLSLKETATYSEKYGNSRKPYSAYSTYHNSWVEKHKDQRMT